MSSNLVSLPQLIYSIDDREASARLAGASREATSRFLASLQRAGVVTCRRGRVIVHDPQGLRRYIY